MTALCPGGGPSGTKVGTDSGIAFGGTAISAAVAAAGYPELAPIIGVISAGLALSTDLYCTVDPPADPGITQDDIQSVLAPATPTQFSTAAGRIKDWFLHWYWWEVCQCLTGLTPPPPTIVLPPGQGVNNQLPSGGTGTVCWSSSGTITVPAPDFVNSLVTNAELSLDLFAPAWLQTSVGAPSWFHRELSAAFPAPVQWALTSTLDTQPVNGGCSANRVTNLGNGTSSGTQIHGWNSPGTTPLSQTTILQQSNLGLRPKDTIGVQNADHAQHSFLLELQLWCSNPNLANTPCCPPDPLVQRYLQIILNLVIQLGVGAVPIAPPTSWSDGVRHSGLSNNGTVTINPAAIGVRWEVTTPPVGVTISPGSPNFYFDMGYVTPVALTSPLRGWRLTYLKESFVIPEFTDQVGYTLLHGTVADMVELLPVFD